MSTECVEENQVQSHNESKTILRILPSDLNNPLLGYTGWTRVLAPSPTPALTHKHVSIRLNKFQLGLQFVTKQNYSFFLGKATFGTHCIRSCTWLSLVLKMLYLL
jgi:hypothetical protein